MDQMTGIDATFLYLETNAAHMHVLGTIILDPAKDPKSGYTFDRLRQMVSSRLHLVPQFRRRMVHVPLRLGHPLWVDDPHFRLSAHLHRIALPSPGSQRELAAFVGHVAGIVLDRDRPLWEIWAVEGLEGGRAALVCKFHHAAIDGVSGVELLQHLLDLSPDADISAPPQAWSPEPAPSDVELAITVIRDLAFQPFRMTKIFARTASAVAAAGGTWLGLGRRDHAPAMPLNAPDTMLNQPISSDRSLAFGDVSLEDVKRIKNAHGLKINDVVLAACSLAIRKYMKKLGELPAEPLTAAIPVSVRDDGEGGGNNAVSAMFVRLPVHLERARDHLQFVAAECSTAKKMHGSSPRSMLPQLAELASPTWFAGLMNLYSSYDLAGTHAPLYNLVVSNVPGPPVPLYCVGSPVAAVYPVGPIFEGAAINITVMSYVDRIGFGVIACPDTIPDLEDLADAFEAAVAQLRRLVPKPEKRRAGKRRGRRGEAAAV